MIIEDSFVITQPVAQVWQFFMDIPRVSQCVPGASGIRQVEDDTYSGSIDVRVGPIAANFQGKVTLTELEPPTRLVASVDGQDRRTASFIKGTFTAVLDEAEGETTEVSYEMDVNVRGRLGQFGSTVMQATAKEMTLAFVECVQKQLAPAPADPSPDQETNGGSEAAPAQTPSLVVIFLRALRRMLRDAIARIGGRG